MFDNIFKLILTTINDIDTTLFLFLNSFHSATWDIIFSWITSKTFWVPVIVFIFFLASLKFKWRTFYLIAFFGLVFLISDQTSVNLFKEIFQRLRPCHNPEIANLVHTVNGYCGGQYGFVSSHATNSFALALFFGLTLKNHYRFTLIFMLFWATLVSYSRIYVGVHYPGDIIGGAIIGSIVGILVFLLMKFLNNKFHLKIENI